MEKARQYPALNEGADLFGLFSKRADPGCLRAAGARTGFLLDESLRLFCSTREFETGIIDQTIGNIVEAQMMVVSFSTSLFNYALIDAYHDAGLADPISGMPKIKFSHDDSRAGLREAWSGFSVPARMNLDMRYRFVLVQKLMNPEEQELWGQMEMWSEHQASRHFEMQRPVSTGWAAFIAALHEGDAQSPWRILRDPYAL